MKIYAISGLGADRRVFEFLEIKKYELIPLDWIEVKRNESIAAYSKRLANRINTNEEFAILGVSFGGLVAVEISKKLNPTLTILISTVETKSELRQVYTKVGKLNLIRYIPEYLFKVPNIIAYYLFGAKAKKLLNQILNDTDLGFTKWALNEFVTWNNNTLLKNRILKIEGEKDKLIPPTGDPRSKIIKGGEHFMIVDKAEEISEIINSQLF